jgi:hypothetical protein
MFVYTTLNHNNIVANLLSTTSNWESSYVINILIMYNEMPFQIPRVSPMTLRWIQFLGWRKHLWLICAPYMATCIEFKIQHLIQNDRWYWGIQHTILNNERWNSLAIKVTPHSCYIMTTFKTTSWYYVHISTWPFQQRQHEQAMITN